jgi:hypothetical protein
MTIERTDIPKIEIKIPLQQRGSMVEFCVTVHLFGSLADSSDILEVVRVMDEAAMRWAKEKGYL